MKRYLWQTGIELVAIASWSSLICSSPAFANDGFSGSGDGPGTGFSIQFSQPDAPTANDRPAAETTSPTAPAAQPTPQQQSQPSDPKRESGPQVQLSGSDDSGIGVEIRARRSGLGAGLRFSLPFWR